MTDELTVNQRFLQVVNFYHTVKHYPLKTAYRVAMNVIERETKQKIDIDKIYADVVKYYIEKKHYSLERANAIAQKVTQRELQKSKAGIA